MEDYSLIRQLFCYGVPQIAILITAWIVLLLHELGHLTVARRCGVHVSDLEIGSGPKLYSNTDGRGTRWRFAALPLRGSIQYVAGDFNDKTIPQKMTICLAGPIANILVGAGIFSPIYWNGSPTSLPLDWGDIALWLCMLFGTMSILVGSLNLMPIPPLDGGHFLFLAMQAYTGHPVSSDVRKQVCMIGYLVLVLITVGVIGFIFLRAIGFS